VLIFLALTLAVAAGLVAHVLHARYSWFCAWCRVGTLFVSLHFS
jgi:hypothetical protein